MIDRAIVEHIARLARLSFTDVEANRLQGELADILGYVEQLAAVPRDDDAITVTMTDAIGTGRPDEPRPSLDRGPVMQLSPDADAQVHGMFIVPGVLDDRVADDSAGDGGGA